MNSYSKPACQEIKPDSPHNASILQLVGQHVQNKDGHSELVSSVIEGMFSGTFVHSSPLISVRRLFHHSILAIVGSFQRIYGDRSMNKRKKYKENIVNIYNLVQKL